jgi:DNA-binding transcriptional LysR family regulator
MDINYELLRTFVVTGRARTYTEASAVRRVTPSAISQQLKTLEAQLGIRLFERVGRRSRLTPEGQRLLDALAEPLAQVGAALGTAADSATAPTGTVRVGSPRTFGAYWLRPRLKSLLSSHPALRMAIEFDVPSVLERRVAEGQLDFALLVRPSELPGVVTQRLATETFVAVGRPPAFDPKQRPCSLADFARLRYLVFDRDQPMHSQWWKASFGRKAPLPQNIACEVASLEELLALAEQGVGIAVLPDYHVESSVRARRVFVLGLEGGPAARNSIFLGWRGAAVKTPRFDAVRAALCAAL